MRPVWQRCILIEDDQFHFKNKISELILYRCLGRSDSLAIRRLRCGAECCEPLLDNRMLLVEEIAEEMLEVVSPGPGIWNRIVGSYRTEFFSFIGSLYSSLTNRSWL